MKIHCIKKEEHHFFELTIDEWYECNEEDENFYWIVNNDCGYEECYPKSLFLTEKEERKLKLKKINESR
jgi:hypothetical protein